MGDWADYREHDGLGLAALLRKRAISPKELLEVAIARAEMVNPLINALSQKLYDYGRDTLNRPIPEGPFACARVFGRACLAEARRFRQSA